MLDPNFLESELNNATALLAKSKVFISDLVDRVKSAEANAIYHLTNSSTIENVVSNVSSKFTVAFTDFADFLDMANAAISNSVTNSSLQLSNNVVSVANTPSVTVATSPTVEVVSPVPVAPVTVATSPTVEVVSPVPVAPVSVPTPTIAQEIVTNVEEIPTRIKTETGEIIQDVTRMVHNIDPRLLHNSNPVTPSTN